MFGINGAEFMVLALVALLVVGPDRLPAYAEQLGRWVRSLRVFLVTARERVAAELGEEAEEVDWAALDPRQYDPRRIVREALLEDPSPPRPGPTTPGARRYTSGRTAAAAAATAGTVGGELAPGAGPTGAGEPAPAPYDDEAT
ncbi:MAG TPA: twin-arginine translocase TatA/TatE family subunit [Actinotalea sp.]|nr:twin-arginine translocase TatA/TatE family subunit [Actinotalea sp.]